MLAAGAADAFFVQMLLVRPAGTEFFTPSLLVLAAAGAALHLLAWIAFARMLSRAAGFDLSIALRLDAFTHLPSLLLLLYVFRPDLSALPLLVPVVLIWPLKYLAYRYLFGPSRPVRALSRGQAAHATAWLAVGLAIYVNLTAFGVNLGTLPQNLRYLITQPTATYAEKMRAKGWLDFPSYAEFVRERTPADAVLLLPPRTRDRRFKPVDDPAVALYFFYPRGVVHAAGLAPTADESRKATHVVVAPANPEVKAAPGEPSAWPTAPLPGGRLIGMPGSAWGLIELAAEGQ